ncbi:dTDP-4-dehydrorhamnose 3,5-epimerase [Ammoniphilus resinae]|uniref:dTDP-4-dehydrorhamnose 3,5-epimerase n=1 Tax=Ammoniphilus resinae TaxID=861532 RepID=A0ABS4GKP0_9BACL|nr:dTDP-4-dehydrorhamnose 3,5-epimerase [Ammoniphilus resinae]MBP1930825.1 dTDP-4-dehydrorhamnose 3,5-epimerase [Ammoniphilus resinae]
MKIEAGCLPGIYEISFTSHQDHRGSFTRIYDQEMFEKHGLQSHWVQENRSYTQKKGTIRGLHLQFPPFAETKMVRVSKGAIWDVFVDLRKGSSTFAQWGACLLQEDIDKMLYIPKGFAHGFCTLTDHCEVIYKVDNYYSPSHEGGILWNDPDLGIVWPHTFPVLSRKDEKALSLKEFIKRYEGITL